MPRTPRQRLLVALAVAVHRHASEAVALDDRDWSTAVDASLAEPPAVFVGTLRVEDVALTEWERRQVRAMIDALDRPDSPDDAALWQVAATVPEPDPLVTKRDALLRKIDQLFEDWPIFQPATRATARAELSALAPDNPEFAEFVDLLIADLDATLPPDTV